MSIFDKYLINNRNWHSFPINHAELNGASLKKNDYIKANLADLRRSGIYCHSCKKDDIEICLRIGISDVSILSRLDDHYGASRGKDKKEEYNRFFGDFLGKSDLTIWYKPIDDVSLLKQIEKMLVIYYLPVWEFPYELVKPKINSTDKLLEFGKKLQEKAHYRIKT